MYVSPNISPIVGPPTPSNIWDDCIAYFDFSIDKGQRAIDLSGHGNYAQLGSGANAPTWTATGIQPGASGYLLCNQAAFDNLQQFTVITVFNIASSGGGSGGRIWDKGQRRVFFPAAARVAFAQNLSGGDRTWSMSNSFSYNVPQIATVSYDATSPLTDPVIRLGASTAAITLTSSNTGTVTPDTASDLYIGNNSGAIRNLDGTIYLQAWYKRILTNAEYLQKYNYLRFIMAGKGITI